LISVSFYTLGCKVNQIETEAVSDAFREGGCTVLPWIEPEENPGNGLHGSSDLCIRNAVWWARLAYARENAGEYRGAVNAYERALELNKDLADARKGLDRVRAYLASR